jgi:ubiquitin-protein ligase
MVLEHVKKMLKLLQRRKMMFLKNNLCGDITQNGVFVFDIYLPPDYPQVPPMVTFLTT